MLNIQPSSVLNAYNLQSCLFINNGNNTFTIHPLPVEAQISQVNSIVVNDFNKDGFTDIMLAGNNFSLRPEIGRMNASRGCLLQGDGKGNFTAINNSQSGVNVSGEVRDMDIIMVGNKKYIIVAKSNMQAQILKVND